MRNTKLLKDFPSKKGREEFDNLKEMKSKEQRNKLAMDRLKRQLDYSNKKNENLREEIKIYEDIINNIRINITDNNVNKIKKTLMKKFQIVLSITKVVLLCIKK